MTERSFDGFYRELQITLETAAGEVVGSAVIPIPEGHESWRNVSVPYRIRVMQVMRTDDQLLQMQATPFWNQAVGDWQ